jgi:hypothetical protein
MRLSKAGHILLGAGVATVLTLAGTGIAAATSHGSPQPPGQPSRRQRRPARHPYAVPCSRW